VDTDHICGTAEARVIKFYTLVDYIVSYLMDNKPPLKGAWLGSHDLFLMPTIIYPEWLKRKSPNFVCR